MQRVNAGIILTIWVLCGMMIGATQALCAKGDGDQLAQSIRQHVENNMSWPVEDMRMEFLSKLPSLDHLTGKMVFRITPKPGDAYIGDTSFSVRILNGGTLVREETVRVRIEVMKDFVVSAKSLAKGSVLTADDVTIQRQWVRRLPANTLSSIDEALGRVMMHSVRPNIQMTYRMIAEVMPVKKGKMVSVILDNGLMQMVMKGIAEEDGAEDALIRVRNVSSNKVIYARVIGPASVRVDF